MIIIYSVKNSKKILGVQTALSITHYGAVVVNYILTCGALLMSHMMRKPGYAIVNNKGADQPAHVRSLISTFVVHCLDSLIPILAKSKI